MISGIAPNQKQKTPSSGCNQTKELAEEQKNGSKIAIHETAVIKMKKWLIFHLLVKIISSE